MNRTKPAWGVRTIEQEEEAEEEDVDNEVNEQQEQHNTPPRNRRVGPTTRSGRVSIAPDRFGQGLNW